MPYSFTYKQTDRHLRGNGSPHVTALPGEVEGLNAGLAISLETENVNDVEQFWREERDGQVEEAVSKAHGRHQTLDRAGRNGVQSTTTTGGGGGSKKGRRE